jgi:hypothetical protein
MGSRKKEGETRLRSLSKQCTPDVLYIHVHMNILGNGMKHIIQSHIRNDQVLQPVEPCLGGDEPRRRDEVEAAAVIQIAGIARTA